MLRWTTAIALIALFAGVAEAEHWQADDPQYIAPLVSNFAIERLPVRGPGAGNYPGGTCVLVVPNYEPSSDPISEILPSVEQIGVSGPFIVGRAGPTYFLFDTRQSDKNIQYFYPYNDWLAALKAAGISDVQVKDADAYAASLPDRLTHPWNYAVMHGCLCLSDDEWSGIIEGTCLVAAFLAGIAGRPRRFRLATVVALGMVADSLGDGFIERDYDGPGLLILFFFLAVTTIGFVFGTLLRLAAKAVRRLWAYFAHPPGAAV